ncbi:hypothetical protein [Verrucomicrobium spinosum]|uniref:hypothetical protein n=1 Tax=Verrucomicrobium spinosum TaxID=2736 RepID=UPI0001745625|nr:hypothetical protein [Verrucomicrobium spinosum]
MVCTWLLLAATALAHPFDGDGAGEAADASRNTQVYLYLEPGLARVECLMWLPAALERLGQPAVKDLLLPEEARARLIATAREAAPSWCRLRVNHVNQQGGIVSATVLKGMPGRSETIGTKDAIPVIEGMMGLIWQFELPPHVESVELEWTGFDGTITKVPVTIFFGSQAESGQELTAAGPMLLWKNTGLLPDPPPLAEVPKLPAKATYPLPAGAIVWTVLGLVAVMIAGRSLRSKPSVFAGAMLMLGAGAWLLWPVWRVPVPVPGSKVPEVTTAQATAILSSLVENVYRSFDQNSESAIYDVLERSVNGPLLQNLYLQTSQALTLDGQDGTRVKVNDLYVHVDKVTPLQGREGFVADCQWTARGTVGHWGHLHQRLNRYTAKIDVEPVEGAWKMTGLEVLEERRL